MDLNSFYAEKEKSEKLSLEKAYKEKYGPMTDSYNEYVLILRDMLKIIIDNMHDTKRAPDEYMKIILFDRSTATGHQDGRSLIAWRIEDIRCGYEDSFNLVLTEEGKLASDKRGAYETINIKTISNFADYSKPRKPASSLIESDGWMFSSPDERIHREMTPESVVKILAQDKISQFFNVDENPLWRFMLVMNNLHDTNDKVLVK